MGNNRARLLYEADLPDSFQRPQTDQYPLLLGLSLRGLIGERNQGCWRHHISSPRGHVDPSTPLSVPTALYSLPFPVMGGSCVVNTTGVRSHFRQQTRKRNTIAALIPRLVSGGPVGAAGHHSAVFWSPLVALTAALLTEDNRAGISAAAPVHASIRPRCSLSLCKLKKKKKRVFDSQHFAASRPPESDGTRAEGCSWPSRRPLVPGTGYV